VNDCAASPCGRSRIPRIGPVGKLWICCGHDGTGSGPRLQLCVVNPSLAKNGANLFRMARVPESSRQSQEADRVTPRLLRFRKPCCDPAGAGLRVTVTDELDQQVRDALQSRRRSRIVPIALIMCAVGGACAYLWVNFGDQVRTAVFGIPPSTGSTVAARAEQPVSRADFEAFERPTLDTLHSITARLDAQQADLRRLADQVAGLSAKVETMQTTTSSLPAQTPVAPVVAPAPPRPPTVAQRRKPVAPTTSSGPISTGGAPLPPDH
jgi:hypothetical protein